MKIYIDVNRREVVVKDNKNNICDIYSNLSTANKKGVGEAVKLLMYSINKIFLIKRFNDFEFEFFINNEELVHLIKDEYTDTILKNVKKEWKDEYDLNTISEVGNFLKMFNKIHSKNISFWEKTDLFENQLKREKLYKLQSECDSEIQDVLHEIRSLKKEELNNVNSTTFITKLWYASQKRLEVKKQIKKINNEVKKGEIDNE